jgi:hypothetical protein
MERALCSQKSLDFETPRTLQRETIEKERDGARERTPSGADAHEGVQHYKCLLG